MISLGNFPLKFRQSKTIHVFPRLKHILPYLYFYRILYRIQLKLFLTSKLLLLRGYVKTCMDFVWKIVWLLLWMFNPPPLVFLHYIFTAFFPCSAPFFKTSSIHLSQYLRSGFSHSQSLDWFSVEV